MVLFLDEYSHVTSHSNKVPEAATFLIKSHSFPSRFNKREEAQEAVSALNNVIPQGGSQPLTVRMANDQNKSKTNTYVPTYNSSMQRGEMSLIENRMF